MNWKERASNLILKINKYNITFFGDNKVNSEEYLELLEEVQQLFDDCLLINEPSQNQLDLLYFVSNLIGVPQYFDLYLRVKEVEFKNNNGLMILSSGLREASSFVDEENKLHYFQREVYKKFTKSKNRFILSAPTSFGKTFIVSFLIKKMNYSNVALIFPSIALLTENLSSFLKNNYFVENYSFVMLSNQPVDLTKKNIFIFTPERFLKFMEIRKNFNFNFIFIDEIYKIDNNLISDKENDDNSLIPDRDLSFRLCLEQALNASLDLLLTGPFLKYATTESMRNFEKDNDFERLNYDKIDLVKKEIFTSKDLKKVWENTKNVKSKKDWIRLILTKMRNENEQTIIYSQSTEYCERYAREFSESVDFDFKKNFSLYEFINHLERNFNKEWCLIKSLKKGVGIHHGRLPKYIQREVIKLFNQREIKEIFCTTTIIEGVNTTAKNVIIASSKKARIDLEKFDLLNIEGRSRKV